jgi:hypothetical protein
MVATLSAASVRKGPRERPATPADIPHLAKLGLESFVIDFSSVTKPIAKKLDEEALFSYQTIYVDRPVFLCRRGDGNHESVHSKQGSCAKNSGRQSK